MSGALDCEHRQADRLSVVSQTETLPDFPSNGWEAPNLLCSDGEVDPMELVTSTDAKERLAELIERAAKGEDVCILDPTHGRIRLTPSGPSFEPKTPRFPERIPGLMQGKVSISKH